MSMRRRNSMDLAPQALLFAAGVVMSLALISLMVIQFNNARALSNTVNERMLASTRELREGELTKYDGLTVTGSDLVNFCRHHGPEDLTLTLDYSQKAMPVVSYSDLEASSLRDIESQYYVRPSDRWVCTVNRNTNEVITEIVFKRKDI